MVWPRDDAAVLEAVNGLRVANPSFGVRPLLAKLREQQPELGAGRKEVREALRALGPLERKDDEEVLAARALAIMQQARRAGRKEQNLARQPCSKTADASPRHPPFASTELWFSDGKMTEDASPSNPPYGSTLQSEPHPTAAALANDASTSYLSTSPELSTSPASPATVTTSAVASTSTITTTAIASTTAGTHIAAATSNAVSPTTITTPPMLEESRQNQGREGTGSTRCKTHASFAPPCLLPSRSH